MVAALVDGLPVLLALLPGGTEEKGQQGGEREGDDEAGGHEDEGGDRRNGTVRRERVDGETSGKEASASQHAALDAARPAPLCRLHVLADVGRDASGRHTWGMTVLANERNPSMSS